MLLCCLRFTYCHRIDSIRQQKNQIYYTKYKLLTAPGWGIGFIFMGRSEDARVTPARWARTFLWTRRLRYSAINLPTFIRWKQNGLYFMWIHTSVVQFWDCPIFSVLSDKSRGPIKTNFLFVYCSLNLLNCYLDEVL